MAGSGAFPKVPGDKIYAADIEALRRIPKTPAPSNYVLAIADVGRHVQVVGSVVTIPGVGSGLQSGDVITVYNASAGDISFSNGGATYLIAGTSKTPTKLAVNGLATFLCLDGAIPKFVVTGGGLS